MNSENEDPESEGPTEPSPNSSRLTGSKKTPNEIVPTDRMAPEKYLEVLRAFSAASDSSNGPVDNKTVGSLIGLAESTVLNSNAWLCEIGALVRAGNALFNVSLAARDYAQAYEWKAPDAGEKLKPLLQEKWFSKALLPRLRFKEMTLETAAGVLAQACNSSPHYRVNLERVVQFMDVAGLCRIEGTTVHPVLEKNPALQPEKDKITDPPPATNAGPAAPIDAPFLYLDKKRERKVTLLAPDHLTSTEVNKIKQWLELVVFIEDDAKPS